MKRNVTGIVWGFCIMLLGIIALLKIFDIISFNLFFDGWWSLFIIVPSLIGLIFNKEKISNIFFLILGFFLLGAANNLLEYKDIIKAMICVGIILVGIKLLINNIFVSRFANKATKISATGLPNYTGIFGGASEKIDKTEFLGCNTQAIFGSVDLDLREATIKKDVYIESINIFGGTDIRIPDNVSVVTSGVNICGGTDSKKNGGNTESSPTIYIKTICIFGGVEVK